VSYFDLPIVKAGLVSEVVAGPMCTIDMVELRSLLDAAGLVGASVRRATCECDAPRA
jgi:hypothetical protein